MYDCTWEDFSISTEVFTYSLKSEFFQGIGHYPDCVWAGKRQTCIKYCVNVYKDQFIMQLECDVEFAVISLD